MDNNKILQDNLAAIDKATTKIKSFVSSIIDEASFVETDVFTAGKSFIDGAEALGEGVVTGYATIGGIPVHIFAQNAEVLKGSFGEAHAKKIKKVIAKAVASGTPLISVIDSHGARVGEGVGMLEAYAEVIAAANDAKDSIPHICIVKGACVGIMAAFAATADFVYMSKDSVMSVTPPMVLASNEKDYPKLNSILGYEAYSAASDVADFTYKNEKDLAASVKDLLTVLAGDTEETNDDANRETPALDKAYSVETALKAICDNSKYIELNASYAKDVRTLITKINSISCAIIATDSAVCDGDITAEGIEKATDFINKCSDNTLPIITLVDAKGIKACTKCETKGLNKKLAQLMSAIANSPVEKISVIAGKAIGAVYSALASKGIGFDYSLAFANAEISPINADTAVNIVYTEELKAGENREKLAERYATMQSNPFISAKDGYVDNIINASTIRPYLASALMMLLGI